MNIADTEKEYLDNYRKQSRLLIDAYHNASQTNFPLDSIEITKAIILRMKVYYQVQEEIKKLLNKRYAAPAADYFVESVLYFIKISLQISNSNLQVFSERAIRKKKNSIRPDISIWDKNKVVAIIECKTQLGWNRNNWETAFQNREKKLISLCSTVMGSFFQDFAQISNKIRPDGGSELKIRGHTNSNFVLDIYLNTCFSNGHVCT